MTGMVPKVELKTDLDVLRFTRDVVIPHIRTLHFVSQGEDLSADNGPQLFFGAYGDEATLRGYCKHDDQYWPQYWPDFDKCGTFGCLGGWFTCLSGHDWLLLSNAFSRFMTYSHDGCRSSEICTSVPIFSRQLDRKNFDAREELEARAIAIQRAIENIENA